MIPGCAARAEFTLSSADLRNRLARADVPDEVLETLSARLDDSKTDSASVARAIGLPWTRGYARPLAIAPMQNALESVHFAPPRAVAAVAEHVAAHNAQATAAQTLHSPLRLLCLSGPDGVGKTAIAQSIARALDRPFEVIDLAQLRTAEEIWRRDGQPGALMGAVEQAQSAEAVVVLAGLDRAAERWGAQASTLLARLSDPQGRANVFDPFFGVPFDLSRLLLVVTCRWTQSISADDLPRLDIAEFPGFLIDQKAELARRTLVPNALADHGLTPAAMMFDGNALLVLIRSYTDESGVAHLDKLLRRVIRRSLVADALGRSSPGVIASEHLFDLVGRPPVPDRPDRRAQRHGHTAALVVDEHGGRHGIATAVLMPGLGHALVPGLGRISMLDTHGANVSTELAVVTAAIRSRLSDIDVSARFMQEFDIQVHVPASRLAGDSGSVGLAVAIAIVSLARDRPVDPELAATGSLSVNGRVEPIGGVAAKMLAAHRAGVRRILLPRGNERDLDDLPPRIHDDITFIPVDDIAQALHVALR